MGTQQKRQQYDDYVAEARRRWEEAGHPLVTLTLPSFGAWLMGAEAPAPPPRPEPVERVGVVARDLRAGVRAEEV